MNNLTLYLIFSYYTVDDFYGFTFSPSSDKSLSKDFINVVLLNNDPEIINKFCNLPCHDLIRFFIKDLGWRYDVSQELIIDGFRYYPLIKNKI